MLDGNIHCHVDNLARRNGKGGMRVAVATAAYNAGQRLWSEHEQRHVDFGNRADVVFSSILLPGGAPSWATDRESLWNKVDLTARRKDARLAKSIVAAVSREIPAQMRVALLQEFVAPFVALGCIADIAIHEDGTDHNPHIHVLLTTRRLAGDGFADKLTALEQRAFVKQVRKRWADLTNSFHEKAGSALRVDHRSYKARGIGAEPTVHRGPDAVERREKREHARRIREEKDMGKPDAYDRQQYPLLAQRQTWPPEPEASAEMTAQERDEHHRYWQDQHVDRLERKALEEPDTSMQEASRPAPQPSPVPWWEQAVAKARSEPEHGVERGAAMFERHATPLADYERGVFERAHAMSPSQAERDVLNDTRGASQDERKLVEDFILRQRMETVRERDRNEALRRMRPELREKLEALRPETVGPERDRPVPGPNGELLSQRDRDIARERMLEEYIWNERDREQDR